MRKSRQRHGSARGGVGSYLAPGDTPSSPYLVQINHPTRLVTPRGRRILGRLTPLLYMVGVRGPPNGYMLLLGAGGEGTWTGTLVVMRRRRRRRRPVGIPGKYRENTHTFANGV